jgi:hypothetical protein
MTDDDTSGTIIVNRPRTTSLVMGAIVCIALAFPVFAADPSASPDASPSASAAASAAPAATPKPKASEAPKTEQGNGKPDKANKGNKGDKTPGVPITLRGTIVMTTDAKGRSAFSLTAGGKTYDLSAGPPWFWGTNNPLEKYAGKSVTVVGETHTGSTEVDVETVDGTAVRAPGKPPWAGGWKVVGKKHPGWSQEKADRFKAKFGDCFPPGQCKAAGA